MNRAFLWSPGVALVAPCGVTDSAVFPATFSCNNRQLITLAYGVADYHPDQLNFFIGVSPVTAPQVIPDSLRTVIDIRPRRYVVTIFWNEVHVSPAYSESTFAIDTA